MLLSARDIRKEFTGVLALDGVSFNLRSGEVHALMGENGAGKSTLIKVVTGVYQPHGGEVLLDGTPVRFSTPSDAVNHGISTVYQEINLAPNLSVAENICLGREPRGAGGIRWAEVRRRAKEALARLGVSIDVGRQLGGISIAHQQLVAIARALDVSCKVLILDEPTSSLDKREVAQLFEVLRRLRQEGMGIVFVTHFLEQVYEISDRITVLRNGKLVGEYETAAMPRLQLVSAMLGRDASELTTAKARPDALASPEPILAAQQLGRRHSVHGVTLSIAPGEVVGLAGLLGSGRTETVRMLYGLDAPHSGTLKVKGSPVKLNPFRATKSGFGLSPEDRKAEGILPDLSVRENLMLVVQSRRGWWRRVSRQEQQTTVEKFIRSLRISTSDAEKPVQFLSGGNQQKVLLARWLAANPRLLMLDEPTRGIDVGAKFEIANLVEELRAGGMAFVFVSSELEEVVRSATKVVILRDRRMVAELKGGDISERNVLSVIAGEPA